MLSRFISFRKSPSSFLTTKQTTGFLSSSSSSSVTRPSLLLDTFRSRQSLHFARLGSSQTTRNSWTASALTPTPSSLPHAFPKSSAISLPFRRYTTMSRVTDTRLATPATTSPSIHPNVSNGDSLESQPPSQHGNFDLVTRVNLDYAPGMFIEKWRSRVTGLTVLWASFDSPLLNCYMTLATEIFQDSGVPHTLEHLIFLGSEKYPYKGVLDTLANRAFASGTNAWTATDHTAYTLTTAGSEGFLRMLPVYLDHVFHPTLTKSGFVTEVYHVNPKGEDAGVVFSEMQGIQNTSSGLMELKSQRMLYPKTSGYRSETGGLMEKLRVLTIEQIRDYHKNYYTPHNAALVICGPLERTKLLDTLVSVEEKLVKSGQAHGPTGPRGWKRPFVETDSGLPPTIDGSKLELPGVDAADPPPQDTQPDAKRRRAFVDFPEKDESVGEVELSWVGPKCNDWLVDEAISSLSSYLTDSPVSAIQQAFVERDDPLCTDVYIGSTEKSHSNLLTAYFYSVPFEHLDKLDNQLIDLLKKIAQDGIDMDRMAMVIKRERLKLLNSLETKPADAFADMVIFDFLYGNRSGEDLHSVVDRMKLFDSLSQFTSDQWIEVLQKYFIDNPRLVVVGRPSATLAKKLKDDTKKLLEDRKNTLGEDGLKHLEEILEQAKKENDQSIPDQVLQNFKTPSIESIKWIPVGSAQNVVAASSVVATRTHEPTELDKRVQQHIDADGQPLPFFVQFDHVTSSFVTLSLVFSTAEIPTELLAHLNLYLSVFFSLPIVRQDGSGESLTYEQVVKLLDQDTLECDVALGIGSGFLEMVCIEIKVERSKYVKAIGWLRDLIWGSEFSIERLKVSTSKMIQSLPEQKRDGKLISSNLMRQMLYDEQQSTALANSVLAQITKLSELSDRLDDPVKAIELVKGLETIRKVLFRPNNLRASVAGDVLGLTEPRSVWHHHFVRKEWLLLSSSSSPQQAVQEPTLPVRWARDVLKTPRAPPQQGLITSLPTVESSYAYFTANGIDSFDHRDTPALITTLTLLNAMESYLWRYIRGAGLAYGASLRSDTESGLIHFVLYRSPDSAKAFIEAKKVIDQLACGQLEIGTTTLESAKSSLHFSIADAEGTVGSAALESFMDQILRQSGKDRGRRILQDVESVTVQDVVDCLKKYIAPVFDSSTSYASVVAPPAKLDEIQQQLQGVGYSMKLITLEISQQDKEEDDDDGEGSDDSDSSSSEDEEEK